jgi:hypothetical protein
VTEERGDEGQVVPMQDQGLDEGAVQVLIRLVKDDKGRFDSERRDALGLLLDRASEPGPAYAFLTDDDLLAALFRLGTDDKGAADAKRAADISTFAGCIRGRLERFAEAKRTLRAVADAQPPPSKPRRR